MTKQFKFKFNDLTYLHSNSNYNNTVRMDMDYGDIQYINTVYEYLDTRGYRGYSGAAVVKAVKHGADGIAYSANTLIQYTRYSTVLYSTVQYSTGTY